MKWSLGGEKVFNKDLFEVLNENRFYRTALRRPFLLLRISFPGRPNFIQLVPDCCCCCGEAPVDSDEKEEGCEELVACPKMEPPCC